MIVLDTNVLSELMRPRPHEVVLAWFAAQPRTTLYTSSITEAELRLGVAILAPGARREALMRAVETALRDEFGSRVLSFDRQAAPAYADIVAGRRARGRPISHPDAQIAAIALSRRASVATRNVRDFADCGVEIVDPWAP